MDLEQQRRGRLAGEAAARAGPRGPCRGPAAGGGRAAAGRSRESPGSPRRAPRLSCRWKRTARSSAGSISSSGSVRRSRATMLAWPTSMQRPDGRRGDPLRHRPQDERGEGERVGARVDGREVLEGDDHPEALRARGERRERAGLRQPAGPRWPARRADSRRGGRRVRRRPRLRRRSGLPGRCRRRGCRREPTRGREAPGAGRRCREPRQARPRGVWRRVGPSARTAGERGPGRSGSRRPRSP